jgi:predicted dehydrogenase
MRVLIIGIGSIGKKHISALRTIHPNIEIIALRHSVNSQKFDNIQDLYTLDNLDEIIVDFAVISNPTSQHMNIISELTRFRIPLFIEKPLHSSLDIWPLVEKIQSLNIINYVACNLRFLESLLYVKEFLKKSDSGQLNEVNVYCGSSLPDWRPENDFRLSYSAIPAMGGGVHIDLIHELDYIYWMFGSPMKIRKSLRNQSSLKIDAVDYANYLLDYDGFSVNVVLNYFRKDTKRTLELVFENKTLNVDLLKNQVKENTKICCYSKNRISDTYLTQMKYFVNCIKNKQTTMNTVADAYNVLKICL